MLLIINEVSYLKAAEWKDWSVVTSAFLLSMRLKPQFYAHWMLFSEACRYLTSTSITLEEVETVHELLKKFLNQFGMVYGDNSLLTINMHNHLHIKEGLLDYGPAMSHWLFNFERYNSDLKGYNTNNKGCLKITTMLIKKKREGGESNSSNHFDLELFLEKEDGEDGKLFGHELLPSSVLNSIRVEQEIALDDEVLGCLVAYYNQVYDGWTYIGESDISVETNRVEGGSYVSRKAWKFSSIQIFANKYRSAGGDLSRKHRGSYARIYCDVNPNMGTIEQEPCLRPAQIIYFFCHHVETLDDSGSLVTVSNIYAFVRWFKKTRHNFYSYQQNNMEVWSNEFEPSTAMSIVPIMRIHSPIAIMLNHFDGINVIINLPRHLINN
ncbi:uncharacterized protein BX663DRAFT_556362 [Cokeromyces recurvatus]|uniref:uncharacterized protein n=1 Tax=Cokeromyces recurvatus TaxID=90255 RepID=UPI0022207D1E|nr:uncharacterized protein BX663DRAFT_556362 [Cokeromyces recurvatus]KAI7897806.1 hypothetical protein BX663DRAFT_556362 [Cokeromyces recurvatus]